MKRALLKTSLIAFLFLLVCKTSFAQWQKVIMKDSIPESRPTTFVIGDTAYMGNGDTGFFVYSDAFRGYTQSGNYWAHEQPDPSGGGDWGFRFVIGDTAYVGDGSDPGYLSSMYFYTPSTGWTNVPTGGPGGNPRGYMAGFSIGHKGYAGLGTYYGNTLYSDLWEYDPATGSWTQMASFPGGGRLGTVSFASNGKGYVGLGGDGTGKTYRDMYQYDPGTNTWDTMAPMPSDTGAEEPGYFVLCGKLIVTCGDSVQSGVSTTRQTWLFDPTVGTKGRWLRLGNFPGPLPAYAPGGFTMGDTGFIYGGYDGPGGNIYWAHMYRFVATAPLLDILVAPTDTTICAGNTVSLTGSGATSYLWNTTDTTYNILVSPKKDTIYTVSESIASCVFTDTVHINVTPGFSLNVTPNPALVCNGQTITLTASGATSYQWLGTPNSTDTITVSPKDDTTYQLQAINGSCLLDTLIAVNVGSALPLIIKPQDTSLCNGSSVILTVPASGTNYIWSPSASLNSSTGAMVIATPTLQTTYTVSGTDSSGCAATGFDTIYVRQAVNKPVLSNTENLLVTTATQGNQWFLNGAIINGATNQSYTATDTGCYWEIATNIANGCSSNSDTICLTASAIKQLSTISNQLSIYPNPTNGEITLNINLSVGEIKDWYLQITDVLGRTVYTRVSLNYSNDIDLSNLPGGVYFISVINQMGRVVVPIVKQN